VACLLQFYNKRQATGIPSADSAAVLERAELLKTEHLTNQTKLNSPKPRPSMAGNDKQNK
jgi:hypothetical protein